jgi:hypothetical protein
MSFGFSVGDFLTVIKLANKIRKDFSSAPREFKATLDVYVTTINGQIDTHVLSVESEAFPSSSNALKYRHQNDISARKTKTTWAPSAMAARIFLASWSTHWANTLGWNHNKQMLAAS